MKLIIQIPCYNEEKTLPFTLNDLPKQISGIDEIKTLIINDGSTDKTQEIAEKNAVDYIVNITVRRGLANAFKMGIEKSLELGADIIVNTDGDNQYRGEDIERLIKPILEKKSEIVIGCRDISSIKHFSLIKKLLQFIGSYIVRKLSGTNIVDTTSGFRAYSREAALKLNIFSTYTYTIETIIQAGKKGIPITYINIRTNEKLRESHLIKNIFSYCIRSTVTMVRIYLMYEPLKTFICLGIITFIPGIYLVIRFLHSHFTKLHGGHIQSLIVASIFMIAALIITMMGLIGDILSKNRTILEEILYRMKKK